MAALVCAALVGCGSEGTRQLGPAGMDGARGGVIIPNDLCNWGAPPTKAGKDPKTGKPARIYVLNKVPFNVLRVGHNCHAGTRDHLLAFWQGRKKRSAADVQRVTKLTAAQLSQAQFPPELLAKILKAYFDTKNVPVFRNGENLMLPPVSANAGSALFRVVTALQSKQAVIFAFGRGFPSKPGNIDTFSHQFSHTGLARLIDGDASKGVEVLNQLNVTGRPSPSLERTVVAVPLKTIEPGLRYLTAGQRLSLICKEPQAGPQAWTDMAIFCELPPADADWKLYGYYWPFAVDPDTRNFKLTPLDKSWTFSGHLAFSPPSVLCEDTPMPISAKLTGSFKGSKAKFPRATVRLNVHYGDYVLIEKQAPLGGGFSLSGATEVKAMTGPSIGNTITVSAQIANDQETFEDVWYQAMYQQLP
jgi:hypothetical protein